MRVGKASGELERHGKGLPNVVKGRNLKLRQNEPFPKHVHADHDSRPSGYDLMAQRLPLANRGDAGV